MTDVQIETMKEIPVPPKYPTRMQRFIGHYLYRSISGQHYWHVTHDDSAEQVIKMFSADDEAIPGTLRVFEIPEDIC